MMEDSMESVEQPEFDYDLEDVADDERNDEEAVAETADEYAHTDEDPPGVPAPEDLEDQNPGHINPEQASEIEVEAAEQHAEQEQT